MKSRPRNAIATLLVGIACAGVATARADTRTFQLTLTNLTLGQTFSPPLFATHDSTESLWNVGDAASFGLTQLAEEGDNSALALDLSLAPGSVGSVLASSALLAPGASATYFLTTDSDHPFLSSAWMLAYTNDGFSGTQGLEFNLFGAQGNGVFDLGSYDAGTEVNNELAQFVPGLGGHLEDPEHGVITEPHPGILGIGDIPLSRNFSGSVARLSITTVPEPGAEALLLAGILPLVVLRARRTRRN